jgi:rhodanese-related sulfurtransferase
MKDISPEELEHKLEHTHKENEEALVDVRSPREFQSVHIRGAMNIPLDEIEEAANKLKSYGTVYVTCGTGVRSQQACQELQARGVNVVNVKGGLTAWQHEGLRVDGNGKHVLPIIRQVMIIAGLLVLVATLLGWLLNPYWYILATVVGAGLLFAGVSGFCFMAYCLEKMPWNR